VKLQFRHQLFQENAANMVCNVFAGQLLHTLTYMIDSGLGQNSLTQAKDFTCFSKAPVSIADIKVLVHTHEKTYKEGDLIDCFEECLSEKATCGIAEQKPCCSIFRDSGFTCSSENINVFEIFKLLSQNTNVRMI
jgi:hypothetical protein